VKWKLLAEVLLRERKREREKKSERARENEGILIAIKRDKYKSEQFHFGMHL
jgi:hypothetical protein